MPTGYPTNLNVKFIIKLYKSGLSAVTIAERLKTNHRTILNRLIDAGIKRRNKKESALARSTAPYIKPLIGKPCLRCQALIFRKPGQVRRVKFCSLKCRTDSTPVIFFCQECDKPKRVPNRCSVRKFCSLNCYHSWSTKNLHSETTIEKIVQDWLAEKQIKFQTQAPISKFFADILIPELKLVVECDGDHWHNLPGIPERDRMRNIIMKRLGYKVVRLKESDIRNTSAKKKLMEVVSQLQHPNKMGISEI